MYFCYIVIISHEKTAWPLLWTNFNPLHPNMLCATFYWNLPIGSGYDFNFFKINFVNVYSLFRNYIPLENGVTLSLNDLIPLHLRMLCAKLSWNWSNGSGEDFQISSMFFAISWLSPLGKKALPIIWTTWIPFTQGCFEPRLVEIGSEILEKKMTM